LGRNTNRERSDRERSNRERSDRERSDIERSDRERSDRERSDIERSDTERSGRGWVEQGTRWQRRRREKEAAHTWPHRLETGALDP